MEIGSKPQQPVQQKRVCLHNVFHHAKLHFTTKYTSEGSNGDDKSSVLSLQYHHRGIYQYPNYRQSAHQYGSINMGDFLHGLIPADFQEKAIYNVCGNQSNQCSRDEIARIMHSQVDT
eukprot:3483577-Prorocentrum_lima.AAC.1